MTQLHQHGLLAHAQCLEKYFGQAGDVFPAEFGDRVVVRVLPSRKNPKRDLLPASFSSSLAAAAGISRLNPTFTSDLFFRGTPMPQPNKVPIQQPRLAADQPLGWAERLIRLDEAHFFDPVVQTVVVADADGAGFNAPSQSSKRAAGMVESDARREGYKAVQGGYFWNEGERRLYVKETDQYVLCALDRRADDNPS
jgi:hypothetical protein